MTTPTNAAPKPVQKTKSIASTPPSNTAANITNTVTTTTTPAETAPVAKISTAVYIDQVVALYDFQSTTPETIGFQKDSIINIIEKSGDWWLGELNGKIGLLPYNYVQSITKSNG